MTLRVETLMKTYKAAFENSCFKHQMDINTIRVRTLDMNTLKGVIEDNTC